MIVIDASVAFKWFDKREEFRDKSLLILHNHLDNSNKIVVPSLLYLEVANALVTKTNTKTETVKEDLDKLNNSNLQIHSFTKQEYIEAAVLSRKHGTTVYDMLYAVIAKKLRTVLITADQSFIKKTKFPFVKPLSEYRGSNEI